MTPLNSILPSHKLILTQMRAGTLLRRTWGPDAQAFLGDKKISLEIVERMVGRGLIQVHKTVNGYTRYRPAMKANKALRLSTR